jgi:hypothetical protein
MDPFDDDNIEERIQTSYGKFQKEPNNPAHSLAIATLYEQRREYANAIPWLENALFLRPRGDSVLEGRILEARIRALKDELGGLQAALETEHLFLSPAQVRTTIDQKLDELNSLLKVQNERRRDPEPDN